MDSNTISARVVQNSVEVLLLSGDMVHKCSETLCMSNIHESNISV